MNSNIIKDKFGISKRETFILDSSIKSKQDYYIKSNSSVSLMKLASEYYGDFRLWKLIASANNLWNIRPPDGVILRIPMNSVFNYIED